MKIFVTGAAGFVGSATVKELLSNGHTVLGLARSDENAAAIKDLGGEVLRGDIKDLEALAKGASSSDGVIHLAYIHDFSDVEGAAKVDEAAIQAMADAIEGTGKPLIITQGLLSLTGGGLCDEDTQHDLAGFFGIRPRAELLLKRLTKEKGFRGMAIRLSPSVHGEGDRGLVTYLIGSAKQNGLVAMVDGGNATWSAVHRLDVARLFRLAVEKGEAGATFHAVAENLPIKSILEVLSEKLALPLHSMSLEAASQKIGFLAGATSMDRPCSAVKTEQALGWKPQEVGLLEDLKANYF